MSVINNVLRDLETRASSFTPIEITTVAAEAVPHRDSRQLLGLGLVLVISVSLVWLFLHNRPLWQAEWVAAPAAHDMEAVATVKAEAPVGPAKLGVAEVGAQPSGNQIIGLQIRESEQEMRMEFALLDKVAVFLKERGENSFGYRLRAIDSEIVAPVIKNNRWIRDLDIVASAQGVDINFQTAPDILVETRQHLVEGDPVWAINLRIAASPTADDEAAAESELAGAAVEVLPPIVDDHPDVVTTPVKPTLAEAEASIGNEVVAMLETPAATANSVAIDAASKARVLAATESLPEFEAAAAADAENEPEVAPTLTQESGRSAVAAIDSSASTDVLPKMEIATAVEIPLSPSGIPSLDAGLDAQVASTVPYSAAAPAADSPSASHSLEIVADSVRPAVAENPYKPAITPPVEPEVDAEVATTLTQSAGRSVLPLHDSSPIEEITAQVEPAVSANNAPATEEPPVTQTEAENEDGLEIADLAVPATPARIEIPPDTQLSRRSENPLGTTATQTTDSDTESVAVAGESVPRANVVVAVAPPVAEISSAAEIPAVTKQRLQPDPGLLAAVDAVSAAIAGESAPRANVVVAVAPPAAEISSAAEIPAVTEQRLQPDPGLLAAVDTVSAAMAGETAPRANVVVAVAPPAAEIASAAKLPRAIEAVSTVEVNPENRDESKVDDPLAAATVEPVPIAENSSPSENSVTTESPPSPAVTVAAEADFGRAVATTRESSSRHSARPVGDLTVKPPVEFTRAFGSTETPNSETEAEFGVAPATKDAVSVIVAAVETPASAEKPPMDEIPTAVDSSVGASARLLAEPGAGDGVATAPSNSIGHRETAVTEVAPTAQIQPKGEVSIELDNPSIADVRFASPVANEVALAEHETVVSSGVDTLDASPIATDASPIATIPSTAKISSRPRVEINRATLYGVETGPVSGTTPKIKIMPAEGSLPRLEMPAQDESSPAPTIPAAEPAPAADAVPDPLPLNQAASTAEFPSQAKLAVEPTGSPETGSTALVEISPNAVFAPDSPANAAVSNPQQMKLDIKSTHPNAAAESKLDYALQLMNSRRLRKAESLLRELMGGVVDHDARRHLLAIYSRQGRSDRFTRLVRDSMSRYPQDNLFTTEYARVLFKATSYHAVIRLLTNKTVLDVDQLAMVAASYQRLNQHDEAIKYYRLSLEQDAGNAKNWIGLGISLEHSRALPEALKSYQRAGQIGRLNNRLQAFVEKRSSALLQALN